MAVNPWPPAERSLPHCTADVRHGHYRRPLRQLDSKIQTPPPAAPRKPSRPKVPPPAPHYAILSAIVFAHLAAAELVKRRFYADGVVSVSAWRFGLRRAA